jgi:hypothetical protein
MTQAKSTQNSVVIFREVSAVEIVVVAVAAWMQRNNYVPAVCFMAEKQSRSSLYTPPTSFLPSHKLPMMLLHFLLEPQLSCKSDASKTLTKCGDEKFNYLIKQI